MRIMIDTNIIISAWLKPEGRIANLLKQLVAKHEICICTFSIEELQRVVERKFPQRRETLDTFLQEFSFELLYTPTALPENMPAIRDENDYPILVSAMAADVDILLTGDKDFTVVDLERPKIATPQDFL